MRLFLVLFVSVTAIAAPKLKTARIKIAQLTPQSLAKHKDVDELLIASHCGESGPGQTDIPDSIGKNVRLKSLLIGQPGRQDCELATTLPDSLSLLKNLRTLGVDDSLRPKGEFPAVVGKLEGLEDLRFTRQGLTAVPPDLRKLKHLKALDLSSNEIKEVPEWLGELKHLETLRLNYNHVRKIPASLAHVKKITLGNNSLKKVDQATLKKDLPGVDFENAFDDGFANE